MRQKKEWPQVAATEQDFVRGLGRAQKQKNKSREQNEALHGTAIAAREFFVGATRIDERTGNSVDDYGRRLWDTIEDACRRDPEPVGQIGGDEPEEGVQRTPASL